MKEVLLTKDPKEFGKPELTGRRRYRYMPYDIYAKSGWLALEVEEAVYTFVSGIAGWEMRWRNAVPEDIIGTDVIGVPDKAR